MNIILSEIEKELPVVDKTDYRSQNNSLFSQLHRTCIVIDDDPTGNQTVHDITLLTKWDVETIANQFRKQNPIFFILTNSRSLTSSKTSIIYNEIISNITIASTITQRRFSIISRSDSTLRGHFVEETNALQKAKKYKDAITVFIPAMFEGGRVTVNDIHYISDSKQLTPVNETPFSKDHSFGYTEANLVSWIIEKTKNKINSSEISTFSISEIRTQSIQQLSRKIIDLTPNTYCIVNTLNYSDLDKISHALLKAQKAGKTILFRTSSSFVPSYIGLITKGLLKARDFIADLPQNGGLLIVGSYVQKSSDQLKYLLKHCNPENVIEIDVHQALNEDTSTYIKSIITVINNQLLRHNDIVIYTSRKLITGKDTDSTINIASKVSYLLTTLIRKISTRPKYILAKGGITSHDIAVHGLGMKQSNVLGQILPGVPVWEMGNETKFPKLPYIVFPGNVGDEKSLHTITQKLS